MGAVSTVAISELEWFLTGCGPVQRCGASSGPWIVSIAAVELELAKFKQNNKNNNKKKILLVIWRMVNFQLATLAASQESLAELWGSILSSDTV